MTASIAVKSDFSTLTSEEEFEITKYDSIDLRGDDNVLRPQFTVFETEAGSGMKNDSISELSEPESPIASSAPRNDMILSEAEGVIDRISEKTVRVKLFPKTYANFPSILFKDQGKIRQGQHVKYLIKKDKEGYRYQELEAFDSDKHHPEKDIVLKLLDELKYRNE